MESSQDAAEQTLGFGHAVLAFDVGGTSTKSALIDVDGRVLGLRRTPTPRDASRSADAVVKHIGALADELRAAYPAPRPVAAGLLVPGIVDAERGIGVYSSNLGWHDEPIRDRANTELGLPIAFHHDVTAASWAEHQLGAGRAFDDAVVLVIGTGIAGSLILGGRPHLRGGYAGEIGHSPIDDDVVCRCGARGCLEAVASAGAIARRFSQRTGAEVSGAQEVLARAAAGEPDAVAVWERALDALAMSVCQMAAMLSPEAVIIGGGLAHAGDALFEPLRARVDARLSFHRRPEIIPAQLGGDAGLLGAALLAREPATS